MVEIELRLVDSAGPTDALARRLLSDLRESDGVDNAALVRRPAAPNERGVVEDVGALVLSLINSNGVQAVASLLKPLLRQGSNRKVVAKLGGGREFILEGGSEQQFNLAVEALLAAVVRDANGETA